MECIICRQIFNTTNNRPIIICNNSHTYCQKCVTELRKNPNSTCPQCHYNLNVIDTINIPLQRIVGQLRHQQDESYLQVIALVIYILLVWINFFLSSIFLSSSIMKLLILLIYAFLLAVTNAFRIYANMDQFNSQQKLKIIIILLTFSIQLCKKLYSLILTLSFYVLILILIFAKGTLNYQSISLGLLNVALFFLSILSYKSPRALSKLINIINKEKIYYCNFYMFAIYSYLETLIQFVYFGFNLKINLFVYIIFDLLIVLIIINTQIKQYLRILLFFPFKFKILWSRQCVRENQYYRLIVMLSIIYKYVISCLTYITSFDLACAILSSISPNLYVFFHLADAEIFAINI